MQNISFKEIDIETTGLDKLEDSLALLYHENSKSQSYLSRRDGYKIGAFLGNPNIVERSVQPFKNYPNAEKIDLSIYTDQDNDDAFCSLVANRKSVREYNVNYKLSVSEIYKILHHAYGISRVDEQPNGLVQKYRMTPSAGGLYPLEIYFYANNTALEKGLYHYNPNNNQIDVLTRKDIAAEIFAAANGNAFVAVPDASIVVFITSVFERQMIKYGDRAYRFTLMEVGSVSQNIALTTQSMGLGNCYLGSYFDNKVNQVLGINGVGETIQNIIVIGKSL